MTTLSTGEISTPVHATPIPVRDWLKLAATLIALIGLGITLYLSYTKVFSVEQICAKDSTFNCELVQSTVYSRVAGVPIQFIGLGGYLAILAVLFFETRLGALANGRGIMIVFGMTLFGFLYSAYLTSIEAFVLKAWCMWCLASAGTMTILFFVSTARLWKYINRPIDLALLDEETE